MGRDIGPYDYGSIMHYTTDAFSRTGRPTIITKVPNTPIGQREGLSALDRAAITQLYGAAGGATPTGPVPGMPPIPGMPQIPNLPLPPGWSIPLPSGAQAPSALPLPPLLSSQ